MPVQSRDFAKCFVIMRIPSIDLVVEEYIRNIFICSNLMLKFRLRKCPYFPFKRNHEGYNNLTHSVYKSKMDESVSIETIFIRF